MPGFDASAYGRRIADVYDDVTADLPTELAVDRLHELAEGGRVLEFGIGTGRLALPLTARGVPVAGVEASAEMLEVLRAKPGGDRIPVTVGDFSTARVDGAFSLVVLAFNTLFALPSQDAQVACFRNAAAHLRPGGRFVVEAWVPDLGAFHDRSAVRLLSLTEDRIMVEAARLFPADQTMRTTKISLASGEVRLLPANHRYAWPAELDLMARMAGMEREHRWSDWSGAAFADDSPAHVSVYHL
ncbi:methyltransferase [Planomonospora parontospora subsp. parontospora]|uniref:Methyltransferase n=2 Tax=Planomonospora parontospora TaxID=58119 RepID=A0AA37F464_9ACTN|nr:class I SAM-dependent methyltransferase [Planomonospora parontospora]GGK63421.1 methyltransferase [Planomonospora parontospora]GII08210.1 methyltransferase [Planomonospora parontospora subsp. parontospora]